MMRAMFHPAVGKVAAIATSAIALTATMPAGAIDQITVPVNATVAGVCKFDSASTMTIANSGTDIDPDAAGPATGTSNVVYRCTSGITPSFTVGGSSVTGKTIALTRSGGGSMTATLTAGAVTPGSGMGNGQGKTFVITGEIDKAAASGGYENAPAGAYTGSIVLDVSP